MTPQQYLRALKAEGVRVVEMPGWTTHNRNHKGSWGPVNGVLIHHTAGVGPGIPSFCRNGSASLPGPLCHGVATKDGRVHLPGYGRANHAGLIASNALSSLVAEDGKHPKPGPDAVDGNSRLYGLEIENRGDGDDPWPDGQYDQSVRWAAAICRHHRWTAESVGGHKEVTRRKIDPAFSMDAFRSEVAERLRHKASWSPDDSTPDPLPVPVPEAEDMPLYTQLSRQVPFEIEPVHEAVVYFELENRDDPDAHPKRSTTVLEGPCLYTGNVAVHAGTEGALLAVGVKMVQELPEGSDQATSTSSTAMLLDGSGTGAVTWHTASVTGLVPAGRKLRVHLINYGTEPVDVSRVDLRLMSWAE